MAFELLFGFLQNEDFQNSNFQANAKVKGEMNIERFIRHSLPPEKKTSMHYNTAYITV